MKMVRVRGENAYRCQELGVHSTRQEGLVCTGSDVMQEREVEDYCRGGGFTLPRGPCTQRTAMIKSDETHLYAGMWAYSSLKNACVAPSAEQNIIFLLTIFEPSFWMRRTRRYLPSVSGTSWVGSTCGGRVQGRDDRQGCGGLGEQLGWGWCTCHCCCWLALPRHRDREKPNHTATEPQTETERHAAIPSLALDFLGTKLAYSFNTYYGQEVSLGWTGRACVPSFLCLC